MILIFKTPLSQLLLMLALLFTISSHAWELQQDKNGIALYTQSNPGSPYISVKLETILESDMQSAVDAVGDGTRCNQWIKMCESVKLLERVTDDEVYFYTVLNFPWPLKNRDSVFHVTTEVNPDRSHVVINMRSKNDYYPMQKFVRMHTDTTYTFEQLEPGKIKFTWGINSNPGGNLKPSMFNKRLPADTRKDLERLKRLLSGS
jgi:hypothetical protein